MTAPLPTLRAGDRRRRPIGQGPGPTSPPGLISEGPRTDALGYQTGDLPAWRGGVMGNDYLALKNAGKLNALGRVAPLPGEEPTVDRWLLEQLGRVLADGWRRAWGRVR